MNDFEVGFQQLDEDCPLYGVRGKSNEGTIKKDKGCLSLLYHHIIQKKMQRFFPVYIVTCEYDLETANFKLFFGGLIQAAELHDLTIPKGTYAEIIVRPKWKFMMYSTLKKAKKFFYHEWLPNSDYMSSGVDYELHTEESVGKHPSLNVRFGITKK